MKILVVCYCYPPDVGPRAFRWSAIAAHWAGQGHEVHVVSARKAGAARDEVLDGVHVHRVEGAITENLRLAIERRNRPGEAGESAALKGEALGGVEFTAAAGVLKRLHDLTWKKLYWPDGACLWFFPARRATLRLLAGGGFDALISTSTPYTGHLVGHAAKKRHPDVHWMVDIGDPFSFYDVAPWNNYSLYDGLNARSEAKLLAAADSVSMTVQSCLDEYARCFPGVEAKTRIIPPVLTSWPAAVPARTAPPEGKRVLAFTGSLYRDIRNPTFLLRLLDGLFRERPDDEVHFYGRIYDCTPCFEPYRELLGSRIFLHGPVKRERALKGIAEADILVNIGNTTAYQLPSKIVDYVVAGRPILNLVTRRDDSALAFLRDYPAALTLHQTEGAPSEADVQRLVAFVAAPPAVPADRVAAFVEAFSVPSVAADYLALITDPPKR